jgi:protein-S-isoprenylcysteine O-methyltransferase Ste14
VKAFSALSFVLMAAAFIGLLLTHSLFSPSAVVISLQVVAVALMIWARLTLGLRSFHATANPTEGGLVTSGPYRFLRHPIYTAVVLFSFAGAFAHASVRSAGFAALLLAGALARMFLEEHLLRVRYPDYTDYASRTKRMVPFVF